jgi:hypothetical protein
MRKRLRWICGACLVAVLATVAGAVWLVSQVWADPADPINDDAFAQIRVGMTDQEVEAVFRNMPGYRENDGQFVRRVSMILRPKTTYVKEWVGPNLTIVMETDQLGRVTAVSKAPGEPVPRESFNARVNRWFGRAPVPAAIPAPVPIPN